MSRLSRWRFLGFACIWGAKFSGGLLSWIATKFFVHEKTSLNRPTSLGDKKAVDHIRLFVLHEDLFRGDLEELAGHERVTIYCLDVRVQYFFKKLFYGKDIDTVAYYQHVSQARVLRQVCDVRTVLRAFFPRVLERLRISAIVTANVRYLEDLDWCAVGEEEGVPWFVLYREGLLMFPRAVIGSRKRHECFGKFFGTHIGVQNEVVKKMFVDSNFVEIEQVTVCGAPRVERLKRLLHGGQKPRRDRKRVLVLYFTPGKYQQAQIDNLGPRPPGVPTELFVEVMQEIVGLAIENPQIDFLVKPKKGDSGIAMFTTMIAEMGYRVEDIGNLIIDDQIDVHDAILASDVICGLQTTAILEAAVCEKPVILPYFKRFRQTEWSDRFGYRQYLELFLVPDNVSEFREMILAALEKYNSEATISYRRRKIFSEWISPLDKDTVQATVDVLTLIRKGNAQYCE
jgi:hypothetical protein